MKMTKNRALFLTLVLCGIIFSSIMLFPRLQSEAGDKSVAVAVYHEDVLALADKSGLSRESWLETFAKAGVGYVVFESSADAAADIYGMEAACVGNEPGDWAFIIPGEDIPAGDAPIALIENIERNSVLVPEGFDLGGQFVKALELYPSYANRGVDEIALLIQRACIDRGMRLVLLRPFTEKGETVSDPAAYESLSLLRTELAKRGLDFGGKLQTFETKPLSFFLLWGSGLLTAALWIFLVCRREKLRKFEFWLYLLAVPALGAVCFIRPELSQKGLMLACAAVFPCYAILGTKKILSVSHSSAVKYLLGLCGLGAWSILGGLAVSALMSSREYLLGYDIFSGVKLSQAIPLGCCFAVFAIPVYKNIREKGLSKKSLLGLAAAAIVLAAAAYLLMLRSGDLAGGIGELETAMRSALEEHLYARPRTKEFLIAVPFAALLCMGWARKNPLIVLLGALACCLECVSVVNTFCHAVAPVGVSVIRTLLGLGIGAVLGLALLGIEYLIRKSKI